MTVLPLANIEAQRREYNSAHWTEVAKCKDDASITSKGVIIA